MKGKSQLVSQETQQKSAKIDSTNVGMPNSAYQQAPIFFWNQQ